MRAFTPSRCGSSSASRDPYLNAGVAQSLHEQFPTSDLFLLPARHYVQVDAPGAGGRADQGRAAGAPIGSAHEPNSSTRRCRASSTPPTRRRTCATAASWRAGRSRRVRASGSSTSAAGRATTWPSCWTRSAPRARSLQSTAARQMLEIAARRCAGRDNATFAEGDATALPVADADFDAALSVQVFEYVPDIAAALGELHRALRPGGRVLIWDVDWATGLLAHRRPGADAAGPDRVGPPRGPPDTAADAGGPATGGGLRGRPRRGTRLRRHRALARHLHRRAVPVRRGLRPRVR